MAIVYLGLGTNIGNRRRNLILAAALLAERAGDVLVLSDFYETDPWGFASEHLFLNAVLKLSTTLDPLSLLELTQSIEKDMGRTQKSDGVYHDRIIDIDLLLYDQLVLSTTQLTLPHPLMHERKFVMQPLAEIAPLLKHPLLNKTMIDLNNEL